MITKPVNNQDKSRYTIGSNMNMDTDTTQTARKRSRAPYRCSKCCQIKRTCGCRQSKRVARRSKQGHQGDLSADLDTMRQAALILASLQATSTAQLAVETPLETTAVETPLETTAVETEEVRKTKRVGEDKRTEGSTRVSVSSGSIPDEVGPAGRR